MASLKRKYHYAENGQVYHETVASRKQDLSWLHGPKIAKISGSRSTTPTLLQIAQRTLLDNLHQLPTECLQNVPWQVVADVWKRAQERKLDRFNCWRAFALAFPDRPDFRWRAVDVPNPSGPLQSYLTHLDSHCTRWLTCLTISNKHVTKAELVRLPTMLLNLVALEICPEPEADYPCTIDDRLFRAWGALVKENKAGEPLANLHVLVLRQPHVLTAACMNELLNFPALSILIVQLGKADIPSFEAAASRQGWLVDAPDEPQYAKVPDDGQRGRQSHAYGMLQLHSRMLETSIKGDLTAIPCADFSFGLPWKNRSSLDRHHSTLPDSPYPKPYSSGPKTMCFVKIGGMQDSLRAEETHVRSLEESPQKAERIEKQSRKPAAPPQKRRRVTGRGHDLESMLSSFTQQRPGPSNRVTKSS